MKFKLKLKRIIIMLMNILKKKLREWACSNKKKLMKVMKG